MQIAGIGVQAAGLIQCSHHMRVAMADMGDVIDRIDIGAPGMVKQICARSAHDFQLFGIADRQVWPQHLGPATHQNVRGIGVNAVAFRGKPQDQVRVGHDLRPDRPQAGLTDAGKFTA